ncbi:DDE_Tnp_1-associated [Burkholderia sp. WP9]|uniref:transposase family protein n=1 Tax=Burkholderia sp. WP9 TaxID=1500263 RepID=UPI00089429AB|nr:DDE_Tnp_1-associated [Burkholderia sp. WP9]
MIFGGVFSELRDARRAQGKRYAQQPLLCAIVMSLMAGANSFRTIEVFISERRAQLNELFGTRWRKAPSHALRRSVKVFSQAGAAHMLDLVASGDSSLRWTARRCAAAPRVWMTWLPDTSFRPLISMA